MKGKRRSRLLRHLLELGRIVRLLQPYLRTRRAALAGGALLTLLLLALRLAQPWPLKWIVDGLTGSGAQPLGLAPAGAVFLAVAVLAALVEYSQVMLLVGVGNHVLYSFRADLFRHVLAQPLGFHEGRKEGELLTRVVFDTTRLRKGLNSVLTTLLQTLLTFAGVLVVLFLVDAVLAAVLAVAGAAALHIMVRDGHRVRKAARRNRRREGGLAALVAEDLITVREIQTFRPDPVGNAGFERMNAKSLKQEAKVRRLTSRMLLGVEVLISVGIAAVLLVGARRVAAGALTAGELVLFLTYATALYRPFFSFARQTARLGTSAAAAERLRRLMLRPAAEPATNGAVAPVRLAGAIELRQVGVKNAKRRRGSRKWALREVDLRLEPGERVAVLGPNGAGKSSLLRIALRLVEPHGGELRVDGRPAADHAAAALRANMSVVLQDSLLFGLTVRENLAIGRADASEAAMLEAARRAGALPLIEGLPKGLDTPVRRRGSLLSAGERQRLAITRALLRDGAVWLLDEPTTGLDAETARALTELLEEVTRGRTTIWVTHDPRLAGLLERVLYLDAGRVRFDGTRDAFRAWMDGAAESGDAEKHGILARA